MTAILQPYRRQPSRSNTVRLSRSSSSDAANSRTLAHVPSDMRSARRWLGWRYETRKGKRTKVPINPRTGRKGDPKSPSTWGTLSEASAAQRRYRLDGVGFALGDGYIGVDLDRVRDAATGAIAPWAQEIIDELDSYTEVSPSGEGVHIWARGELPEAGRRRAVGDGGIEIYASSRYFTVTGAHLDGTPTSVEARGKALSQLWARHFIRTATPAATKKASSLSDNEILERARNAKNGASFIRLWAGETSDYDSDQSRADLALVSDLAFWSCDDEATIDRLFRRSGLMRDKWDERRGSETYGQRTIRRALAQSHEVYKPSIRPHVEPRASGDSGQVAMIHHALRENPAPDDEFPDIPRGAPFPELEEAAFYGLAGEIVKAIEPHTESHPMALLAQILTAFGAIVGRDAGEARPGYFRVGADRHYAALYTALVGDSAKARKGTSWSLVMWLLDGVIHPDGPTNALWMRHHIKSGLSTGEGLIHAFRDITERREGELNTAPEPLQADKRLLVRESELARVLRAMARDGNILSAVLRDAWDGHPLSTLTKHAPECATNAHLSIVGHITRDELLRYLTATEAANGFGNRFLWIAVKRVRLLPEGGALDEETLTPFRDALREAIAKARTRGEMRRDPGARDLWRDVYPTLTESAPGLLGAMTARSEAQIMRLALIYALLDESPDIQRPHLEAALAFWRYYDASVRYIFGDSMGDPTADAILRALRDASSDGLTRTQVSAALGRNIARDEIARALGRLLDSSVVIMKKEASGGRPLERFWLPRFYEQTTNKSLREVNSCLFVCPECGGHETDGILHNDGPHCAQCDLLMIEAAS